MSSTEKQPSRHAAGAFDVRNVIAGLIGFYGVVLVVMGVFWSPEDDLARTGGVNANLWAGIGMLVFAAAFAFWTWQRPVVVDPGADVSGNEEERPAGH